MEAVIEQEEVTTATASTEERFHICDEKGADWYLGKLAAIDAEIGLIKAQAGAAVKRLQSDREGLERLFGAELEEFVRGRIAGGRKKSLILLHGTAGFRTVPARYSVLDEAAAELHAAKEEMEGAFVSKFSPGAYLELATAALEQTGELLPGVERVPERESFSVKFGAKE